MGILQDERKVKAINFLRRNLQGVSDTYRSFVFLYIGKALVHATRDQDVLARRDYAQGIINNLDEHQERDAAMLAFSLYVPMGDALNDLYNAREFQELFLLN